ncbi:MAG: helix-turn-helix transcriptional regulator [Pseudomonadota bacterium]|nr:helix-turn-helix transcriptional regulator [Pseudomonadota bacterium]
MTAQIIEIAGQRMAVMPVADYERLCEAIEDRSDGDSAVVAETRRLAGEEYISAAMVDRLLAGENPLRVWRQHRGLTLAVLGEQSGVLKSTISELENGKAQGKPVTWRALADALSVMVDDILPTS